MLTAVTVSDLLYQLGDIPASRVRLQPWPGTATEADVIAVHTQEKRLCELVDGVLVEKTMGYYEAYLAATLIRLIGNFVVEHDLSTRTEVLAYFAPSPLGGEGWGEGLQG
jgi:hypothetical protein